MSEYTEVALKEIQLDTIDLIFGSSMLMSFEKLLIFTRFDIAEILRKDFIFTISLLGTTIYDGGIKERSNETNGEVCVYTENFSKLFIFKKINNLLHRGMVADCDGYNVTTYIEKKRKERRKKERNGKEKKR